MIKKYVFLNTHDYYNKNPKDILNHMKKICIKSNIGYDNIYKPRVKTVNVSLYNIIKTSIGAKSSFSRPAVLKVVDKL